MQKKGFEIAQVEIGFLAIAINFRRAWLRLVRCSAVSVAAVAPCAAVTIRVSMRCIRPVLRRLLRRASRTGPSGFIDDCSRTRLTAKKLLFIRLRGERPVSRSLQ